MRPLVLNIVNASHVNALKSVLFTLNCYHVIILQQNKYYEKYIIRPRYKVFIIAYLDETPCEHCTCRFERVNLIQYYKTVAIDVEWSAASKMFPDLK